ncbi:MAG: small-conductance mechanosensitive channel [Salibacteraceae bacterium]|jgi:small-conductance mechanosensitive channel
MRELDSISFTVLPIQILVAVAVCLGLTYILLKLVKRYLFVVVKSESWNQKIEDSWHRIQIGVWLFVSVFLLIYLLNNSFLITVVMLLIALIVGGKYWRDLINGILIAFEHKITEGDYISSDKYSGVVSQLGSRGIQIRLDAGDVAFVPYRSLNDYKIRKLDRSFKSAMSSIVVKVRPQEPIDSAISKLKKAVLQIPYTMLTQPIKVEVVELNETGSTLRVLVHSQTLESGKLLEMELNQELKLLELI